MGENHGSRSRTGWCSDRWARFWGGNGSPLQLPWIWIWKHFCIRSEWLTANLTIYFFYSVSLVCNLSCLKAWRKYYFYWVLQLESLPSCPAPLIMELDSWTQDDMVSNMRAKERMQIVLYSRSKHHFIKIWYFTYCYYHCYLRFLRSGRIDMCFTGGCCCSSRCMCWHICRNKWVHWFGIVKISEYWKRRLLIFIYKYWGFNFTSGHVSLAW